MKTITVNSGTKTTTISIDQIAAVSVEGQCLAIWLKTHEAPFKFSFGNQSTAVQEYVKVRDAMQEF